MVNRQGHTGSLQILSYHSTTCIQHQQHTKPMCPNLWERVVSHIVIIKQHAVYLTVTANWQRINAQTEMKTSRRLRMIRVNIPVLIVTAVFLADQMCCVVSSFSWCGKSARNAWRCPANWRRPSEPGPRRIWRNHCRAKLKSAVVFQKQDSH